MKIATILALFYSIMFAQNENEVKMIQTEYAFAKNASEVGTRQAFLNFIADDGILFRPAPVNGKQYLEKSDNKSGLLNWYPTKSQMSLSGDMGFTSGPWNFKKDKDSTEIGFGHFCTIWEKQKDGSFKFVIDYGISHGKLNETLIPLNVELLAKKKVEKGTQKISKDKLSKIEREGYFPIQKVYIKNSSFLIDGYYPFNGEEQIDLFFKNESIEKINYIRIGEKISRSNDFGFTYGIAKVKISSSKEKEYYYLRVWQQQKGKWIVLSEIWNPVNS